MKRTKKAVLGMLTLLLGFSAAGTVLAFWSVQKNTDNILTMGSYKASILETYKVPDHVNPADRIEKMVHVKNNGTVDILVRVSVTKAFGVRRADNSLQKDDSLDPDMIEIDFNDTCWEKRKDGWFYYRDVLRAGETTREPLMTAYTLSPKAGNEYKGKEAEITVCMESVQAEGEAVSAWKVSLKELGIVYQNVETTAKTAVSFRGKDEGFAVSAQNTDLFASFKNLLPGCARIQQITVENASKEEVELFLHAEETKQVNMSSEQRELVRQLLEKYAVIELTDGDRLIYRGAVCGQDEENSMRSDISLGKFAAGEAKMLTARLALSPEMDNRFLLLTGKVRWVFSAKGEDGSITQTEVPVTGDYTKPGMWLALLLVSAAAFLGALHLEKRDRRKAREVSETFD